MNNNVDDTSKLKMDLSILPIVDFEDFQRNFAEFAIAQRELGHPIMLSNHCAELTLKDIGDAE